MLKDISRSRMIQVWFVAVLLVAAAGAAFGVSMTVSTGAMMLAMSLVPPAMVLVLWPGVPSPTAGDVLRDTDHRH